jgi:hypothetical protein
MNQTVQAFSLQGRRLQTESSNDPIEREHSKDIQQLMLNKTMISLVRPDLKDKKNLEHEVTSDHKQVSA